MGMGETAELVADLSLKGDFNKQMKTAITGTGKLEKNINTITKRTGAFTGFVNRNLSRAVDNLGVKLVSSIGEGLEEMATLEDATTSVEGAIKQVGKGWTITAADIATAANRIESETDAAFDDKAIVAATETLIRYGKVTEKNIEPAMEVMTDLAARTGDVESASTLLAKALADPAKAAGKLARQGVILTKEQQKQIKAMVKAGKTADAQSLLLEILTKTTKGAAAASAGPYRDALNKLGDAGEDLRRGLVTGLAPAILEVSDLLTKELAKPSTINTLKELGKGIGSALKSAITIAKSIPWTAIGNGIKTSAQFAGELVGWFQKMPEWAQTLLIGGFVATKLPVVGDLVSELGKGLIKGVLGITAGVVNIKAGAVTGGGPGVGPGGGGAKTGASRVLDLASKALLIGFVAEMADVIHEAIKPPSTATADLSWPWGPKNTPKLLPEIFGGNGLLGGTSGPSEGPVRGGDRPSPGNPRIFQKSLDLKPVTAAQMATTNAVKNAQSISTRENSAQKAELSNVKGMITTQGEQQQALQRAQIAAQAAAAVLSTIQAAGQALRDATTQQAVTTGATGTQNTVRGVAPPIIGTLSNGFASLRATIWAARPVIQSTNVVNNYTTKQRTGGTSGSRDGGYSRVPGAG